MRSKTLGLLPALLSIIVMLLSGTMLFHFLEGWNFSDSFYFTGITMATVGYGDIAPQTPVGRIAAVLFAFFSVSITLYAFSILAQNTFRHRSKKTKWFFKR